MNHKKMITKLSKFKKQKKTSFNITFRYIDDVLSLNNPKFNYYIDVIIRRNLRLKILQMLQNGLIILTNWNFMRMVNFSHDSYDKRDDFDFLIVNCPYLSSYIPESPVYGVCGLTVDTLCSGWFKI